MAVASGISFVACSEKSAEVGNAKPEKSPLQDEPSGHELKPSDATAEVQQPSKNIDVSTKQKREVEQAPARQVVPKKPLVTTMEFGEAEKFDLPGQKQLEGVTFADFDSDGKMDAISGTYQGNLYVRKGIGSGPQMKLAAPVKLQRAGADIKLKHW